MAITEISRVPAKGGTAVISTLHDSVSGNTTINYINLVDMQTKVTVDVNAKVAQLIASLGA